MSKSNMENVSKNFVGETLKKLPEFFHQNPALWFRKIEALFSVLGMNTDREKFETVIALTEAYVLACATDIIFNPPESNQYVILKKRIIKRWTEPIEVRLNHLFSERNTIGDKKPSVFLQHLRSLADEHLDEIALKVLWLRHLPLAIQPLLTIMEGSLSIVADKADALMAIWLTANRGQQVEPPAVVEDQRVASDPSPPEVDNNVSQDAPIDLTQLSSTDGALNPVENGGGVSPHGTNTERESAASIPDGNLNVLNANVTVNGVNGVLNPVENGGGVSPHGTNTERESGASVPDGNLNVLNPNVTVNGANNPLNNSMGRNLLDQSDVRIRVKKFAQKRSVLNNFQHNENSVTQRNEIDVVEKSVDIKKSKRVKLTEKAP